MWPDVSQERIISIFRIENQAKRNSAYSRWLRLFLVRLILNPEDGYDTFRRNIGPHTYYTALYPRRRQRTQSPLWESQIPQKQPNSMALSPQAKYTDLATATCRRKFVPTSMDRGVSRGQRGGSPMVVNLCFPDRSRYFFSSSSSFILSRAEWNPFHIHCYSENLVALRIEPGTSGIVARNSDH
jgi:hypothetical protein